MKGPYVRDQLQKMWDNGVITADNKISNNENGPWVSAIDFFIQKIDPKDPHQSANSSASSEKNMAEDLLKRTSLGNSPKDNFGLSPKNPIPASSIPASYSYLQFLADENQQRVQHKRLGSIEIEDSNNPIDKYEIVSKAGAFLFYIYINPYAGHDTERAPEGLTYFRPLKGFMDSKEGQKLAKKLDEIPEFKQSKKTAKAVTDMQYDSYSKNNSKLSGFKVFCLRFFSVTGYFILISALLGYLSSNIEGLIFGWAGGSCKGMFWGFIIGLVSFFKYKKAPTEYSFKKHVYISAVFGLVSIFFALIAMLLSQ